MFDIQNNNYDYELYLCKTDKTILSAINYIDLDVSFNFREYDEIDFEIPLLDNGWMQVENKTFNLLQPNYLVLMNIKNNDEVLFSEYYIIDSPSFNNDNGVIKKTIHCFSSEYIFNNRYLRSYEQVKVLYDVDNSYGSGIINYMLSQMQNIWTVGYISSSLIGVYHSFNYSSNTFKSVLDDLQEVYNCHILYDTINNEINIYVPEEVGEDTNIIISDEDYLKSLSCNIKNSEMCTRLRVYGKDNTTIAGKNITGQLYIDNISWFRDRGYFSNSLNTAFDAYNVLLASKESVFAGYLAQLKILTDSLGVKNNQLALLKAQLEVIKDDMNTLQDNDRRNTSEYDDLYDDQQSKKSQINSKQSEINSINGQINTVNSNISSLNTLLSYSNNFTNEQLQELYFYIIEGELKLDSVEDSELLYEYAKKYIVLKSVPPIDIDIDLIDLFSIDNSYIKERYNKIKKGNYIYLDCPELGFNYEQYRIVKIQHNKLSNSLSISISNKDKINSSINYLNDIFKKSIEAADDLEVNHEDYDSYTKDKDSIIYDGDDINASNNNILVGNNFINKRGWQGTSLSSDGEIKLMNDKIIFSKDSWASYYTMISSDGVYMETNDETSRFVLTPENGFQVDVWNSDVGDWRNALYLGLSGGTPALFIDNGFISLSKITGGIETNRIYIDPNVGIKIQAKNGVSWEDRFFINTDGNLIAKQLRTSSDSGDYITLEEQWISFYNGTPSLEKMKMGVIDFGGGDFNAYLRMGAGDETGNNYFEMRKDANYLNMIFSNSDGGQSGIGFLNSTYSGYPDGALALDSSGDIIISVGGDLTINGEVGVTDEILVDGYTLTITNGIITDIS